MRTKLKQKVSKLRKLVARAKDISEPVKYFMDNLAADPELLQSSRRGEQLKLESVLVALAEKHFGEPKPIRMALFLLCGNLWHGPCFLGSSPTTFIYFSDIDIGVITICSGEKTDYYRFSILQHSPSERFMRSRTNQPAN